MARALAPGWHGEADEVTRIEQHLAPDWTEDLLALATAEPARAEGMALDHLQVAHAQDDAAAACIALRALGLIAREQNAPSRAVELLQRSVRTAEDRDLLSLAAGSRVTLALTLFYVGETRTAFEEIERAIAALPDNESARARTQRALLLQRIGSLDAALEGFDTALPVLRRSQDVLWQARLLNNRGLLHMQRCEYDEATDDLTVAEELYRSVGQPVLALQALHNRACVVAAEGRFPRALGLFDDAERGLAAAGCSIAVGLQDHCAALLAVDLAAEALVLAERAVEELSSVGMSVDLAEAQLLVSRSAFAAGDVARALDAAAQAERAFGEQGRQAWSLLAQQLRLQASRRSKVPPERVLEESTLLAARLAEAGWAAEGREARLTAAHVALDLCDLDRAERELAAADATPVPRLARAQVQAWHAQARLSLQRGRTRDAARELQRGLAAVQQHRASLGATELRVNAAEQAVELAEMGLGIARRRGGPAALLSWAERYKAGALMLPAAHPPTDRAMVADLAELRLLSTAKRTAPDAAARRELELRQATLEAAVQRRARLAPGDPAPSVVRPPTSRVLAEALEERALVEFIDVAGELMAVVIANGRTTKHELGSVEDAAQGLQLLRFALRRMSDPDNARAGEAASLAANLHARKLDELLLHAFRRRLGERQLVLVPTGALHALPWSMLPTIVGRPTTVAPSAAHWLRAVRTPSRRSGQRDKVALVAGPELSSASGEATEIGRRHYPDGLLLVEDDATVPLVLEALEGAQLAHIAAHARFRADSPLFSSLQLADGPLTVYDMERLQRSPEHLVLAACQSGISAVRPGDELMGLTAALLGLGTRSLVAAVLDVEDVATAQAMLDLHAALGRGASLCEALAGTQSAAASRGPADHATAVSFVCFGAG